MAQKVKEIVKIQIVGGAATPAPPVGIALGKYNAVLERLGMGKFLVRDSGIFNLF